MFERKLEDVKTTIYFDERCSEAARINGLHDCCHGSKAFTYTEAVEFVERGKRLLKGCRKHDIKKFKAIINQVVFAFGPEFEELHGKV